MYVTFVLHITGNGRYVGKFMSDVILHWTEDETSGGQEYLLCCDRSVIQLGKH